jgi:hypothetical protein
MGWPSGRLTSLRLTVQVCALFAYATGVEAVAAFGDDTTAVLFYYPHTARVSDAPTAECFTVADGKITRSVLRS